MKVSQLVDIVHEICGLPENWAKTCIYYCMATYHLGKVVWMPVLVIKAEFGSGKSKLMQVLEKLSYKGILITCHERMTSTSLRNMFIRAKNKTAVIEESDLYPNRKELESYLINRVDKLRTSEVPVTEQVTKGETQVWRTQKPGVFGATILHDRYGLTNLATERRAIMVEIPHKPGKKYLHPDKQAKSWWKNIVLPESTMAEIPDIFDCDEIRGSSLDAWEPLIRVANSVGDDDWLYWAWGMINEASQSLSNGREWELESQAFGAVIACSVDANGKLAKANPIPLSSVTKKLIDDYSWIKPKTISTILRKKFKLDVHRKAGSAHIFTNPDELRKIATEFDFKDDSLE